MTRARLGSISLPVFCAVTPTARDLTVHAGKGSTPEAAWVSAAMEAIERVSAESLPDDARVERSTSFAALEADSDVRPMDPCQLSLPFASAWHRDTELDWSEVVEISSGEPRLLPVELLCSPAYGPLCTGVETNGLASGNTFTEAALHGLYELIERHAVSLDTFYLMNHDEAWSAPRDLAVVDREGLPADAARWLTVLDDAGLRTVIRDLTTDLPVPVYVVTILDRGFAGHEGVGVTFAGFGADLDPRRAVVRAITEAVQSHTGTFLGARDSFEGTRRIPEPSSMLRRRLASLYARPTARIRERTTTSTDLLEDLRHVVSLIEQAGLGPCMVADLTRPSLGVPVVRVVVPGLAGPYGDTPRRPPLALLTSILAPRVDR